jgi:hypothetical protein
VDKRVRQAQKKVKHLLLRWNDCNKHPCCHWKRKRSDSGGVNLVLGNTGGEAEDLGGEREQNIEILEKPVLELESQLSMVLQLESKLSIT